MYDGTCAISNLPYDYPQELERKGIRCKMMNPIKPFLSTVQNNRDHRKICVIDGRVGFTGGINLGDEYINRKERFGPLEGHGCHAEGGRGPEPDHAVPPDVERGREGGGALRALPDSKAAGAAKRAGVRAPLRGQPVLTMKMWGRRCTFHILNHAKKYVHIMTPYLILDNEMITTLTRAARAGIEVIIIMPHIPDKWYAFVVAKTYYRELIRAGVQIYEYKRALSTPRSLCQTMTRPRWAPSTWTTGVSTCILSAACSYTTIPWWTGWREIFQETLMKCHKVSLVELRTGACSPR